MARSLVFLGFAAIVGPLCGCLDMGRPLGIFEWEAYETRAVTTPMPVAPPPMQGDHILDVSLREIGATRTSGSEVGAHRETGMHPLRTDGAVSVRVAEFFAVRALGSLGYGSPIGGSPSVAFPNRASANGGLGAVFGYWGDPDWSVALEVDGMLTLLDNDDQYAVWQGPCYEYDAFWGEGIECIRDRRTGTTFYQGLLIVPTSGVSLDVAGFPVRWLRVGGGASVQELVSRNTAGEVHHEVVGTARLFVEFHVSDVWLGLEAQQWVVENARFAPALAVTVGGVAFERASRSDPLEEEDADDETAHPIPVRVSPESVPESTPAAGSLADSPQRVLAPLEVAP